MSTNPANDPTGYNERFTATIAALWDIVTNRLESPHRRSRARQAIRDAYRGSGSLGSITAVYQGDGIRHVPNGTAINAVDGEFDGWLKR